MSSHDEQQLFSFSPLVPALPATDLLAYHHSPSTDAETSDNVGAGLIDLAMELASSSSSSSSSSYDFATKKSLSNQPSTSYLPLSLAPSHSHSQYVGQLGDDDLNLGIDFDIDFDLMSRAEPTSTTSTSLTRWPHHHSARRPSTDSSDLDSSEVDSGVDGDSDSGGEFASSPNSSTTSTLITTTSMTLSSLQVQEAHEEWLNLKVPIDHFPPLSPSAGEGGAVNTMIVATAAAGSTGSSKMQHNISRGRQQHVSGTQQPRTSEALVKSITVRERELLQSKGEVVPTTASLPLTKMEDRRLRASLRKIRNKDSAIRSRKKKEVYVAGLENRVDECTRINIELTTKVSSLEATNRSLLEQLDDLRRKLVDHATAGGSSSAGSTMMMMVVVCCGLVVSDNNNNPYRNNTDGGQQQQHGFRSRTLKSVHDEDLWTVESNDDWSLVVFTAVARWAVALALVAALWWWMKSYTNRKRK